LAIGCGRQAALATRLAREAGARAVQILDPRVDPGHWDLVIAPEHDCLSGPNVLTLLGSLNPVDEGWLTAARTDFPELSKLPRPRIALLLGGSSPHARFDRAAFDEMAATISSVLAGGGSVLATASRRTDPEVAAALRARMDAGTGTGWPGVAWTGDGDGPNPYPGLLAWADRIVCTPDSVNMISEACATWAPVFVFDPRGTRGRPRRFLDALLASGRRVHVGLDLCVAQFATSGLVVDAGDGGQRGAQGVWRSGLGGPERNGEGRSLRRRGAPLGAQVGTWMQWVRWPAVVPGW